MQHFGDNFIPVIPIENGPLHIDGQRFCGDPSCGCGEEQALINQVNNEYLGGLLTSEEATRLVQGKQV